MSIVICDIDYVEYHIIILIVFELLSLSSVFCLFVNIGSVDTSMSFCFVCGIKLFSSKQWHVIFKLNTYSN